jgi:hypothetical protein
MQRQAVQESTGGRSATVRFSVSDPDPDTPVQELPGAKKGDEFATKTHRRLKTVMLAD